MYIRREVHCDGREESRGERESTINPSEYLRLQILNEFFARPSMFLTLNYDQSGNVVAYYDKNSKRTLLILSTILSLPSYQREIASKSHSAEIKLYVSLSSRIL